MLLCDVNVFVYAMRQDSPYHQVYLDWLERVLGDDALVGVSEMVLSSAVRIVTNHRIFVEPSSTEDALAFCESVLAAPSSIEVRPGERHWGIFVRLLRKTRARGNDVADAYLAAMALEHGATWVTRDRGFARFDGLRIFDPGD